MPEISVIVPVYNVEKYLDRCVESILAQTFTDFELILVDDGSPDNCPQMCDEWAKKDKRIVVIHQPNGGLSAARNAGIDWAFANSDSQWLTFIDSDDWIHYQYLEVLTNTHSDISVCKYQKTQYESIPKAIVQVTKQEYSNEDFFYLHSAFGVLACCKVYKKSLFTELRFPEGKLHEDVFLTYKVIYNADEISLFDFVGYFYFQNDASITKSTYTLKRLDEVQAGEEQVAFFKKRKGDKNYRESLKRLMYYYSNHIKELKALPEGKKYIRKLRRKLKVLIFTKAKYCGINMKNNLFYYEMAFPVFMFIYWRFKRIFK